MNVVLLVLAALIVVAPMLAIAGVIVWLMYRGLTQKPRVAGWPPGVAPRWEAAVLQAPSLVAAFSPAPSATHGVLTLAGGDLRFVPAAEPAAAWSWPISSLRVRRTALGESGGGALVLLETPGGPLRLAVSREPIRLWVHNGFKDMRELAYADEFVAVLVANGARHG